MLLAEQLAPGRFRIVDLTVDAFSGSHTAFRRDPHVHRKTLDEFFERTGRDFARFNYLGEWHSHPSFSVHPSNDDIRSMTEIVEDADSGINFAVLPVLCSKRHKKIIGRVSVVGQFECNRPRALLAMSRIKRTNRTNGITNRSTNQSVTRRSARGRNPCRGALSADQGIDTELTHDQNFKS
jgi:hypothetical protein